MTYNNLLSLFLAIIFLHTALPLQAQAEQSSLNLQGMTGLINIPSAMVLEKGQGELLYSNLYEANRFQPTAQQYSDGVNLNAAVGITDGLEVGMRDVGRRFDGGSDMSMNLKWKLPLIPEEWFDVALGVQDFGGASNYYDAKYLVATKKFKYLQMTAGMASSDSLTGKFNGAFYGMKITPYPWLSLLAEHDAVDEHYGFKLSTPKTWFAGGQQINLLAVASSSNDAMRQDNFFGISFSFPLGINQPKVRQPSLAKASQPEATALPETAPATANTATKPPASNAPARSYPETEALNQPESEAASEQALLALQRRLVKHGFENVQVGTRESEIVIVFENSIFNANSIDALGLVAGEVAHRAPASYQHFTLIMQRNGINVFAVSGEIEPYKAFLQYQTGLPAQLKTQQSPADEIVAGVNWVTTSAGENRFVPRLTLAPEVETVVGSEVGMIDYTLALNSEIELPLAKGLSFFTSHNTAVADSDDYRDGVLRRRAKETGLREAYLSQTFALPYNLTTQFQAGRTSYGSQQYNFGQNETTLHDEQGRYQLGVIMGRYIHDTYKTERSLLIGALSYYWGKPDISFRLTAGNYLGQDVGYTVESRFHFADTQIYITYQDTDRKMVGLGFSIPLTPRKDMSPTRGFQLKGRSSWSYGLKTVIGETRNPVTFGLAEIPMLRNGIAARYYNFDRLSPVYFNRHPERLRDAYHRYQ